MKSTQSIRLFVVLTLSLILAACGGGGGGGGDTPIGGGLPSSQSNTNPSDTSSLNGQASIDNSNPSSPGGVPGLSVSGSAPLIGTQDVTVLFAGTALKPTGLSGNFMSTLSAATASQSVTSGGAFTLLAANNSAMYVRLSDVASIDDVAGNGQYAIGRWFAGQYTVTSGQTSNTTAINTNQGAPYMVGIPLDLYSVNGSGTVNCVYDQSTKPSSLNGLVAPGSINAASSSASIDLSNRLVNLNLSFNIGTDSNVLVTKNNVLIDFVSTGSGSSVIAETVGSDVNKPYLVIAYGSTTPNSGDVGGIVVFKCQ